jgi:hypothetical protein
MAQSLIPMMLLGPTLLLAYARSRAQEAADAPTPCPGAPRRPPLTSNAAAPSGAAATLKATC